MASFISYNDNLFFIMTQIKQLQNGLKLSLHPSICADNYLNQFSFIAKTLLSIQEELFERPQLIQLNEYLQLLRSAEMAFLHLLETFSTHNIAIMDIKHTMEQYQTEITEALQALLARIAESTTTVLESDTVSREELSLLFTQTEEQK